MSEVISFRLDMNNPREAKALEVIKRLRVDGKSTRQTITEALLKMVEPQQIEPSVWMELSDKLSHVCTILENRNVQVSTGSEINIPLSSQFIESTKQGLKPGIKLP